jgi:signal transduction histidine kinase
MKASDFAAAPRPGLTRRTVLATAAALIVSTAPALSADRGTAEEAQNMVRRAVEAYMDKGKDAFGQITAPSTTFRDKDLYVFVIGADLRIVAHGFDPKRIGVDVSTLKDPDGKEYGKEFLAKASAEGAWVDYKFKDPNSGEVLPKSSWVVLHDGFIFGCGIYKP